ncbi:threonine ammonia-lyase IlvA [Aquimarina sp. MMG015]|uniref:threonine ammonia-lyase IlvA n=1 Tax=unclassified Aquimarina TaxID=2627091 RepID=UPI000D554176|nr:MULTISPECIES: threonine ammonia-lyase IlvA [unclassified Aquimarina]MBQ4805285.1 threonine ammonia-lyase IlvA [Aquimarina sp. MMG015]
MNTEVTTYFPQLEDIKKASSNIKEVAMVTPLMNSIRYSRKYDANILLKREDLQRVRSYKIRGAFNKISSLTKEQLTKGVVCASAGNHAQGVAFACHHLGIQGTIYMPSVTPKQKVEQTQMFGGSKVKIVLEGDTFDDASKAAKNACIAEGKTFVHPFDDPKTIEGQGTIGLEIFDQVDHPIDYIFVAVGGGGLASGLCGAMKALSPKTKIIGVEPQGAASMLTSIKENKNTEIFDIDKFIDGAAVQKVGDLNFDICKSYLSDMMTVPEGLVCQTILDLYNRDAIVVEPAGALTLAALEFYKEKIVGKNVVCIVSGSNNDITRTAEIKERALLYADLKHYFIVRFPQRAGALKQFVGEVLGPNDDITHFEYSKKSSRENGPAVVGIELKDKKDLEPLISRMKQYSFFGDYLNDKPDLFQFLV